MPRIGSVVEGPSHLSGSSGTSRTEKVFAGYGQTRSTLWYIRFADDNKIVDVMEYVLHPAFADEPLNSISYCSEQLWRL